MKVRLAAAATAALAVVAAAAAPRVEGAVVTLRVESASEPQPLFEGALSTEPHLVDGGDGSGPHACWGPPGMAPAPSATGALDDALRGVGIAWRGNWDPSFRDFFVDRIGSYASASPDRYWSLTVNGRFSAGGCLTRVVDGDAIRFFYGPLFGPDATGAPGAEGGQASDPSPGTTPGGPGIGPSARALRRVAASATRYLRNEGAGEAWAELALALRGGGGLSRAATGLLVGKLGSQMQDGSFERDVNATALAVLALEGSRPGAAARAATWLSAVQAANGGFGYRPGAPPDIDTTGLACWALALEKRRAAALRAADFIRLAQAVDGGFPALPGGASNAQSTGFATIALRVSGIGPRRVLASSGRGPLDYLASLARRDGSIAYDRRSSPTPVWTTAQALLGLTRRARLLDSDAGRGRG